MSALTMPEFWQLRGIVEAHGEAGACKHGLVNTLDEIVRIGGSGALS